LAVVATTTRSFADDKPFRLGIVGLDTSHVTHFTSFLNDPANKTGCKVVAAYRGGSADIPSSANRLEMFTNALKEKHGVEIVDSIEELCKKVDGILLESLDGRPHLEQVKPVFAAGKPVFIDKPVAASLADVVEIFQLSRESGVPCWTSSTWRFTDGVQAVKGGKVGDVVGCIAYGPCSLEPHHPDFYWYGIHTAETLFSLMGTGCETVARTTSEAADVAVGQWKDGRIGIFRGQRHAGGQAGFLAFGTKGVHQDVHAGGYPVLLKEIVNFFKTGKAPVSPEETLELFAFMSAADESKAKGGVPVRLDKVLAKAQEEVKTRRAARTNAGPTSAREAAGTFRAACVKVDITPKTPQWMHGYGPRKSNGVHDRIYHRIVAMDDGITQFFLVSTDVCTISPSFYDGFCNELKRDTDIKPEQIWWSATHTHAAPHVGPQDLGQLFSKTLGDRFSMKHDVAHWDWVKKVLLEGLKEARSRLEPACLGIGTGESYANINRRGTNEEGKSTLGEDPDGPVDRQIGLIRLERPDGSLIALVTNYAIHGTVLGGKNTLISGDVPGIIAEYVERKVGAPMLFINGAEGDVAPIYSVRADFASSHMDEFHALLGEKILAANDSIQQTTAEVTLLLGKTVIETPRKARLGWLDDLADYARLSADGTHLVRVPVRSLTINRDTVIWAAPLELFSEIAMNIRKASPFPNTFYFGLTNGSLLYMPTKKAFSEGGYEPAVSPFTPQAEEDFSVGVSHYIQGLARP
jgi:hypothetical protein